MRRLMLRGVVGLAVLAVAGYGAWLWIESAARVWTDDASVEGPVVVVSARVPGPVTRVLVRDNEEVREGQVLAEIDPRDYEIRVEQVRAALAMAEAGQEAARTEVPLARETTASRAQQARAAVESARVAVEVARAQIVEARARVEGRQAATAAARADVAVAEATLDKAGRDLERAARLSAAGLIAVQEHDAAQTAQRTAAAAREAAHRRLGQAEREAEQAAAEVRRWELATEQALRRVREAEGFVAEAESQQTQVPVKEAEAGRAGAAVRQARADLAAAELQLAKTRVRAPADGVVSKKTVEVGQLVQAGQPLMAVVPLRGVWVVANFKETQVARIRPGQRATIRVDTFPDRVWHGTVESISAGTGARFSLLPPENATGNWVKVVQRIPVKIVLDGYEANPHVLRAGMSATVTLDAR